MHTAFGRRLAQLTTTTALAMIASITAAPREAEACTITSGGGTLGALDANTVVTCPGITTGADIDSINPGGHVNVPTGATLASSSVDLIGAGSTFMAYSGVSLTDTSVHIEGGDAYIGLFGADMQGGTLQAGGDRALIELQNASVTTFAGTPLTLGGGLGADRGTLIMNSGASITDSGSSAGPLLNGGSGDQAFYLNGAIQTNSNGFLVSTGSHDDLVELGAHFTIGGAGAFIMDGGDGADTIRLAALASGDANGMTFDSRGFEVLQVDAGAGVWMVAGVADFTNINVESGMLQVNEIGALGGADIDVLSGASLRFATSGLVLFNNELSGLGVLEIAATGGELVMASANANFIGGVRITDGVLIINQGDALGGADVINHDTLRIGGVVFDNNVSGSGGIEKTSNNVGELAGLNTHSGGVHVIGGTLIADIDALGGGTLSLDANTSFVLSQVSDGTFINALSADATSSFSKDGAGRVDFDSLTFGRFEAVDGMSMFTGVNTFASGLTIDDGAVVGGTGTFVGDVVNSGAFSPAGGNAVGALTIDGDFTQLQDGVLEIDFSTGPTIDTLTVTGAATLDGVLVLRSLNNTDGSGLTFLTAAGGVTGSFDAIQTPNGNVAALVLQDANSVQTAQTLVTLRPSTFNSQAQLAGHAMSSYRAILVVEGLTAAQGHGVWGRGFGQQDERDADGASLGFEFENRGVAIGYTGRGANGFGVNLSLATSSGDAALSGQAGVTDAEGTIAAAQLIWRSGQVFLHGGAMYGRHSLETDRVVDLNGVISTLNADTDMTASALFGGGGYVFDAGSWDLTASAQGYYVDAQIDGYQEAGTNMLRLDVADFEARTLGVELLLRASTELSFYAGAWRPSLELGVVHERALGDREVDVAFASSGQGATLELSDADATWFRLGAGGEWDMGGGVVVGARVRHDAGDEVSRTRADIGLRVAF